MPKGIRNLRYEIVGDNGNPYAGLDEVEADFVYHYCSEEAFGNPTRAGRLAAADARARGDEWDEKTLGWRCMSRPHVKAAIRNILEPFLPAPAEIINGIAKVAFTDAADVFSEAFDDHVERTVDMDGNTVITITQRLNVEKLRAAGLGYMLKAYKPTKLGPAFELHSSMAAKELLARLHGLLQDKINVNAEIDFSKLTKEQLQALAEGKTTKV